jgi:hypothetical protein
MYHRRLQAQQPHQSKLNQNKLNQSKLNQNKLNQNKLKQQSAKPLKYSSMQIIGERRSCTAAATR